MGDPALVWLILGCGLVALGCVFIVMRKPGDYDDRDDNDDSFWKSINKGR